MFDLQHPLRRTTPTRATTPPAAAPTIVVQGDLTPACVVSVQRRVDQAVRDGHGHVIVDLVAAEGLTTRTVAMLCGALRRMPGQRSTLHIVGAPPVLHRAIELCDIPRVVLAPAGDPSLGDRDHAPGRFARPMRRAVRASPHKLDDGRYA